MQESIPFHIKRALEACIIRTLDATKIVIITVILFLLFTLKRTNKRITQNGFNKKIQCSI